MKMKYLWRVIPLMVAGICTVQAAGVREYRAGEIPDANDIAKILRGGSSTAAAQQAAPHPKMRGIALDPAYQQQPAPATTYQAPAATYQAPETQAQPEASQAGETAFALPVRFGFNSSEIQPDAMPQLDKVAEGMKMVPGARVVVEGHTDASGSTAYNQRLSYRRAVAVKQYLVYRHNIDSTSLVVEGKGESDPLPGTDPYDPRNRRVQFRAMQ
jgi:outer membrane protein OmpA-like peptidoglycan-associated protein